jgi:uncharacterized protein YjiS (DUF1127 family)
MPHTKIETLPFRARTGLVQRVTRALAEAAARRRDRKQLARLDAHILRDIGLSPEAVRDEASKPFWQP